MAAQMTLLNETFPTVYNMLGLRQNVNLQADAISTYTTTIEYYVSVPLNTSPKIFVCKIPLLARALGQARATLGYLVYNQQIYKEVGYIFS